ncbi:MAG: ABC transporter ATP-binding protein [Thermomicrobiales bacterium]
MNERSCAKSPALRMRGIEVKRGARATLHVPELDIAPGEVVTLAGPNGAGKSTLLQVAALLLQPAKGEILISGELASHKRSLALRRRIAMVFQSPLLFDLSVLDNAASGLRFRGVGRHDAEARAREWLQRFGVGHLADRAARTLSGGEAQRVSLARAFAVDPMLILLDEPFAALDPPSRSRLVPDLARNLRESGAAAAIVTHDLDEALALGDRLGILLDGRIAQLDNPGTLLALPADQDVAEFIRGSSRLPALI